MSAAPAPPSRRVPTYCYNCVAGPDLLTVKVTDGVATEVGPNFAGAGIHPGDGKPCVRAYGLIQKVYHPARILTPMRRTNPRERMIQSIPPPRNRRKQPSAPSYLLQQFALIMLAVSV